MEKGPITIKPDITNAILPLILKDGTISAIISLALYGVLYLMKFFELIQATNSQIQGYVLLTFLIIILVTTSVRIFLLLNTSYHFFKSHVTSEIKFFTLKSHSIPYSQISNMRIHISIWDRISNAGDIIIHTADDSEDLFIKYVKNPKLIEKKILHLTGAKDDTL